MRPAGILILLAIVARNGVGPLPSDSESPILPLYERAIKKNKVLTPLSGRCASPYLSRQVSAFRRFRQFLLTISRHLYEQAVDAGMRNFLKAIILRLLHIYVSHH